MVLIKLEDLEKMMDKAKGNDDKKSKKTDKKKDSKKS